MTPSYLPQRLSWRVVRLAPQVARRRAAACRVHWAAAPAHLSPARLSGSTSQASRRVAPEGVSTGPIVDPMGSGDDPGEQSALDWLLSDRNRLLLPTPWLTDRRFEDFVERLLKAQPLLGPDVRHVARVSRWGVPGDKQHGIDLYGQYSDGVHAAWQCKHLRSLTAPAVAKAVKYVSFNGAAELILVFADVAKAAARNEMRRHTGWQLWDRRDLTDMLAALPAPTQRDILSEFWGEEVRRLLLPTLTDAFISVDAYLTGRQNPELVLNDLGPLAGRTAEMAAMRSALLPGTADTAQVTLVSGPGGRGKSRLLAVALAELTAAQTELSITCLAPGRVLDRSAMSELPLGSSVVVVDDAHLDPTSLGPLLSYARQADDVRVVLATRPSALRAINAQISQAGFRPAERTVIAVEELDRVDAERLVKGLTDDLGLNFGLRDYLAGQAQHSPHVAVIATNLIRRGELTASLVVDAGLREVVLSRYRDVLAHDVGELERRVSRKVLATYAALGRVDPADRTLMGHIAEFCGLPLVELARAVESMRDHGILSESGGQLRIVPDVVADSVLEDEAAVGDLDTGFAAELWNTFADGDRQHSLALTLAELDWRLRQRGGPAVMDAVWRRLRERILPLSIEALHKQLGRMTELASTQPRRVVALLEELRVGLRDSKQSASESGGEQASWRARLGLPPLEGADVLALMPELYARAAMNEPELLDTALDAIWAIRSQDRRPPHSHAEHADRMISDHLGNLAKMPDPSFPDRIVDRVSVWLAESPQPEDTVTPLFALAPMLIKERMETVQTAPMTLSMQPVTFRASALRPVRDRIREVLLRQGCSDDLRRAGAAVGLLREALRQPHGYFGQKVMQELVLSWEDDDLATLTTLAEIAEQTTSTALRRRVRAALSWPAEHALSLRVRHAALTAVATLDDLAELDDDIVDELLGDRFGLASVSPSEVPTLEEMQQARADEEQRLADLSEEQQAQESEQARESVQRRRERQSAVAESIAARLAAVGSTQEIHDLLAEASRQVVALGEHTGGNLWGVLHHLAAQAPQALAQLLDSVAQADEGPLDQQLPQLISLHLQQRPQDALTWLETAVSQARPKVRHAIAQALDREQWDDNGEMARIWATGTRDVDRTIADRFLASAGAFLRQAPVDAVTVLLERGISEHAATAAIEGAAGYDGENYGRSLTRDQADAILALTAQSGLKSYVVQTTVSSIATQHPRLVLDHLAKQAAAGTAPPGDIHGLGDAFDNRPDDLAGWALHRLQQHNVQTSGQLDFVLQAATNGVLTQRQGDAFATRLPTLGAAQLTDLVALLGWLDTWPLRHPVLTHAVLERARGTGDTDELLTQLTASMHPRHWGGINGVSPELDAALTRAHAAADTTEDGELRQIYRDAAARIQATIEADRRLHEEDRKTGWE